MVKAWCVPASSGWVGAARVDDQHTHLSDESPRGIGAIHVQDAYVSASVLAKYFALAICTAAE
jgi:hypothetical protein